MQRFPPSAVLYFNGVRGVGSVSGRCMAPPLPTPASGPAVPWMGTKVVGPGDNPGCIKGVPRSSSLPTCTGDTGSSLNMYGAYRKIA